MEERALENQPEVSSDYVAGVRLLLEKLGRDPARYSEALIYEHRLEENIGNTRRYGDSEARKAERAEVIDRLNELALDGLGLSFNQLCKLAQAQAELLPGITGQKDPAEVRERIGKILGVEPEPQPTPMLPPRPPPKTRKLWRWIILIVSWLISAAVMAVVISMIPIGIQGGGLPLLGRPTPTPIPQVLVARVARTGSEVVIDGQLNEPSWKEVDVLTYAVHPAENGSTKATARFLWDEDYLYVGFDVSDTQVEKAAPSTLWDGDSVSLILDVRGIVEYRQSLGEILIDDIALDLKDMGIENDPADTDEGYTVEMRVKWMQPPSPGQRIPADLLSVDHDANPGTTFDAPGTVFSKLSWDGDGDVRTALASLLLVGEKQ